MKRFFLISTLLPIIFSGCSDDIVGDPELSKIENATINLKYPIYTNYSETPPHEEVVSAKESVSEQGISLNVKEDSKAGVSLEFSPYTAHLNLDAINSQLFVYVPSIISLNSTYVKEFTYKKVKDGLIFEGTIDTENFYADITGTLKKSTSKDDIGQNGNQLMIDIKNQKLNNLYGWGERIYYTRVSSDKFDPWLSGGFYCSMDDVTIPGLEQYDISNDEFFNLVFNTSAFGAEEYQGEFNLRNCSINEFFTRGAFKFTDSGVLITGRSAVTFGPHYGTSGGMILTSDGVSSPIYPPSAIRYMPISDKELKLYLNPVLLSKLCTEWKFSQNTILTISKTASPTGYQKMFYELYNSLSPYITEGLNMRKTEREYGMENGKTTVLEFDKEVGRILLRQFISMVKDPIVYDFFLLRINRERPGVYNISKEDMKKAIDALPQIIDDCEELHFGVQL